AAASPGKRAALKAGCAPSVKGRTMRLEQQIEPQRETRARAVTAYAAGPAGRLDDLNGPAADLLRQLADVVVLVRAEEPTHRIVHVRDWPFVPLDLFRQTVGRPLSEEGAAALHRAHVLEVELVQREQEGRRRPVRDRDRRPRAPDPGPRGPGPGAVRRRLAVEAPA